MPLRGVDEDGVSIEADGCTDEEWSLLRERGRKERGLKMPCCPARAVLKTSKLGTRFFAHKARGACIWKAETEVHLYLKKLAWRQHAKRDGRLQTEVGGLTPDGEKWTADVFAWKDKEKVAVEVQWSGQSVEQTWRRQRRYYKSGIKGIPAYPRHSACGDVCSQYVPNEGVTAMGFKVASRVRGLSDEAFREAFGTEEQCRTALVRLRWPDGFVCPCCGHREHCVLAGRGLYQCNRCKKQTSPTAGTIFHATKLPLTLWFAAIHLIVTAKNGISSVELGRRLGVKQPTAWTVKHKIMAVMARREGGTRLTGRVEMDDAYLGGVRSGGKRGRGAAGKTPFVAAVSTSPEGRPGKLKLAPVKGFRKREIARGAKHWLAPGAAVVTDGLGCWGALDEAACSHRAIRTGSGRQAARMASFKWVNTTLGNIKSAITGTYRKLGPDHAGRYLASFAWRYNRRYQLETMIPRFVHSAARTEPMPYRLLIAG